MRGILATCTRCTSTSFASTPRAGGTRDEYQRALADEGVSTSIHFLPVHTLTWYRERYPDQQALPVAERAGAEVLSLPPSPAHSVAISGIRSTRCAADDRLAG